MVAAPALFAQLLDDAAMFPPGNAAPPDALRAHLRLRQTTGSDLVGPLLVAVDRWGEFLEAHSEAGSPTVTVSLVGTAELPDSVPASVEVFGFELPVTALPLPATSAAHQVACEIVSSVERSQLLAAVAERQAAGRRVIAKYRTGGTSADAFPSETELAAVLVDAAAVDAPLKFTAGLHSALRHSDPATGFEHHGFLNLLVATLRARQGEDRDVLVDVLSERAAPALIAEVNSWTATEVAAARRGFVSFGCCAVDEPVADLVKLGLFDPEGR